MVPPGGGREDGKLTDGTATAFEPGLSPGPLAQCGGSWEGFLALHRAGNTYINVHTNDGVGLPNQGPGDFPGGELRGQMLPRDSTASHPGRERGRLSVTGAPFLGRQTCLDGS